MTLGRSQLLPGQGHPWEVAEAPGSQGLGPTQGPAQQSGAWCRPQTWAGTPLPLFPACDPGLLSPSVCVIGESVTRTPVPVTVALFGDRVYRSKATCVAPTQRGGILMEAGLGRGEHAEEKAM